MVVQTAGKHSAITRINRDWETRKSSYVMAARRKNAAQANAPHSAPHTAPSPPRPGRRPPSRRPGSGRLGHAGRRPGATVAQIATDARSSRAIAGRELAVLGTSGLATRTPLERCRDSVKMSFLRSLVVIWKARELTPRW